ncbi:cupredoxin domain-containing protein [Limimaricola sp.]|uniref:cupredoxin domain-containing protein n=1 Tax=Limimaricola sp. TaxID=2211665 RepID=UPI004058AAD2
MKITTPLALALVLAAPLAQAGAGHGDEKAAFGQAGHAEDVTRDIAVSMTEMDFDPEAITVAPGETVRFTVTNDGRIVHEFNIGTPESWKSHEGEMKAMLTKGMMSMRRINHEKMKASGMMHDDANSVLLEPGETGEVIWTFPEGGEISFACNVPGHLAAGMKGSFEIEAPVVENLDS